MVYFIPNCAQKVAAATPSWPAPVSAIMEVLPSRRAVPEVATGCWPVGTTGLVD